MKKYYISHIDFSEIVNVTTDEAQLSRATARMKELDMLTEKGIPKQSVIAGMADPDSKSLFIKLHKRLRRRNGGAKAVKEALQGLCDRRDYYAVFFYIVFLYGFVEWQVPERVTLLPAVPEALKYYCKDFVAAFDSFLKDGIKDNGKDNETQSDSQTTTEVPQ